MVTMSHAVHIVAQTMLVMTTALRGRDRSLYLIFVGVMLYLLAYSVSFCVYESEFDGFAFDSEGGSA